MKEGLILEFIECEKKQFIYAIKSIVGNGEEIILSKQYQLSFFSKKELELIKYCCKTLESLIEAKDIYDKQKIKGRV
ncbi:hypothetical protein [Staphylococcus borealis]|uniref:hypothetical protein n=1 Tax=Staphylococcus borealis TaxID=2742203 RepID=UPI00211C48A7|nr:hypothetical protein [Staphylococcus borealis]